MKKRSLFAAVAMLIVSAILLTSSTYAWFAASHEAAVAKVVAKVSGENEGNVQVSASGTGNWVTSLDVEDILGSGVTYKTLNPVDVNPFTNGGMSSPKAVDFDTTNYTVKAGSTNDMLSYTWHVRAVNRGSNTKIVIPVSFTGGDCLYGIIKVDGTLHTVTVGGTSKTAVWGTGGNDSYVTLGSVTAAVEDGTTAGIIDANDDKTGSLGDEVAANIAQNGVNLEIDISSETTPVVHDIEVTVWAAGQDANCVGGVNVTNGGFIFGTISDQANTGIHLAA